jgi:hypothetical protein
MDQPELMRDKVDSLAVCLWPEWIADARLDYLVVSGWIEFVDNF